MAITTRGSATNVDAFEQAAGALAGLAVVGMALTARPAWPLSIGLALAAFSGHWDAMGVPIALDRLLIGTAIVSTLVRERIRSPDALKARPIDCLLALVAIYAIGSSLIADTWQYESVRFALLDRLSLVGFVLFFVAPKAFREERDRNVLLGSLVALGAYLGLTALFETVGPDALVIPDYISDPKIGTHSDRARGPFAEAAANGLTLYGCMIAAFMAAAHMARPPLEAGRRDRRRALRARDPAHRYACGLDCRHRGHDPDDARRQGDPPVRDPAVAVGGVGRPARIRPHPRTAGASRGPRER